MADPLLFMFAGVGAAGVGLIVRSLRARLRPRPVEQVVVSSPAPDKPAPRVAPVVPAAPRNEETVEDPTMPIALILVTAAAQTDPGLHRTTNEDSYLVDAERHLVVVADGMGGHASGEVASQLAIETIARAHATQQFDGEPDKSRPRFGDQLVRSILTANRVVYERARNEPQHKGMGTTVVAARFSPNKQRVYIAHAGDSRCYRMREGKLRQITKDHTLGSLGVQGPTAGKLVRAIGTERKVDIDLFTDAPEAGDLYLLCSDGLSRMISNSKIEAIVASERDLDKMIAKLVAAANEAGGRDNITVIVVRVDEA